MQTPVETLCKGYPPEFSTYLTYCKNLRFEDKPDYQHCKSLFKSVMAKNNYEYDYEWDWKELKKTVASTSIHNNAANNNNNNNNNNAKPNKITSPALIDRNNTL